jgi:hypothetical protein
MAPFMAGEGLQLRRHGTMPPLPIRSAISMLFPRRGGNQGPILGSRQRLQPIVVPAMKIRTRSNAAIFLLFGPVSFSSVSHRPTRRVSGVSSSGERWLQTVRSFGFLETGVKKDATAASTGGKTSAWSAKTRRDRRHTSCSALHFFLGRRGGGRLVSPALRHFLGG